VRAVVPHELQPGEAIVALTNLETGTQAALNFQRNGSLDGTYFFAELRQARTFARLCLEFMRLLVRSPACNPRLPAFKRPLFRRSASRGVR